MYEKMVRNVIEVMEEQQAKLGFDGNAVYLFYPLYSAARLLGVYPEDAAILDALEGFCARVQDKLGKVEYELREGRITLKIPPEGGAYVAGQLDEGKFIVQLIKKVAGHHASAQDVISLFYAYSDQVHVQRMENGEFDYLVYFTQGEPDAFYYCLKEEMGHVSYHRFLKADYEAFGF